MRSTFSTDKAKADTASMDKYGTTVEGLEAAVAQWEKMLATTEAAVASGNINTADVYAGGVKRFSAKSKKIELAEYLNAGNRKNKKKQEAIDAGHNIILTSEKEIENYIEDSIEGKKLPTVAYGKVGERLAKEVNEYSGGKIDISGYYLEFVPFDIYHAHNEHLKAKEVGDIDLSEEDFKNIAKYIDSYDELLYAIKYSGGQTKIGISKTLPNGRAIIIETVSKSRGATQFKNMIGVGEEKYQKEYIGKYKKSTANSRGSKSSNISLRDANAFSNNIIPDSSEKSNRQNSLKTEDLLSPEYGKTAETTETGAKNETREFINSQTEISEGDSVKDAQTYNIIISNLKRKGEELGILDRDFFTRLQEIENFYNPTARDRTLISSEFRRVFAGNTDPLVTNWLDAIGAEAGDSKKGGIAETQQGDTSSALRSSAPSPQGEGSGISEYFEENAERENVISDKRFSEANAALMKGPATNKKTLGEKVGESVSFIKRKMVNSADAVRKIAKKVKDEHLYGAYNRARSAMNIVSDMLKNKQTNVRGEKVGESLERIIAPIKEKAV